MAKDNKQKEKYRQEVIEGDDYLKDAYEQGNTENMEAYLQAYGDIEPYKSLYEKAEQEGFDPDKVYNIVGAYLKDKGCLSYRNEQDREGENLLRKNFIYIGGKGIKEASADQLKGKEYFSEYYNNEGEKVRREDYKEDGRLKGVIVYKNDKQDTQEHYFSDLKFVRRRNLETGVMEELGPEGGLIRRLEE
jgi:hypothetical protein